MRGQHVGIWSGAQKLERNANTFMERSWLWSTSDLNVLGKGQPADNKHSHRSFLMSAAPANETQVWDLQPIRTAVAMVATVLGASFRFSMCPDIWLSSSTAYLNMKGTVTLVSWEDRVGFRGETGEDSFKQTVKPTYVHLCIHTRHTLKRNAFHSVINATVNTQVETYRQYSSVCAMVAFPDWLS